MVMTQKYLYESSNANNASKKHKQVMSDSTLTRTWIVGGLCDYSK